MDIVEEFMDDRSGDVYEQELAREPYNFRIWWRYIHSKQDGDLEKRFSLYRRALKNLPGSYKLWNNYLEERSRLCRERILTDDLYTEVNNDYEDALLYMHKMPKIWLAYCEFLIFQKKVTKTRHTFDRALQSLPITQHDGIWDLYVKFVDACGVMRTAVCVYRRYMLVEPSAVEKYIDYLTRIEKYDEAAVQLSKVINNENYKSTEGTTKQDMWMKLMMILTKHPMSIQSLNIENVVRNGLKKFSEETGKWWCMFAECYVTMGNFEKARDIYEEAIQTVAYVRDFSMIFDAYVQFEMHVLENTLAMEEEEGEMEKDDLFGDLFGEEIDEDIRQLDEDMNDLDLRQARLEYLLSQQQILLSSVRLRQNPHDVREWLHRVTLFSDPMKAIIAYSEAVKTVEPMKAVGKPSKLWISFAAFYEEHDDIENAENVYEMAVKVEYKSVEELAIVWCSWVEMEIRHDRVEEGYQLLMRAVTQPRKTEEDRESLHRRPPQDFLYRNLKIWNLLVDMEESIGTVETTKAAYERMFDLKIITPQNVLNYGSYLEEHSYYEDAFRVYEKGVTVFSFPYSKEIWLQYVNKFVERYKGNKIERIRDIFEKCIVEVDEKNAKEFYLLYARLEEQYGMIRHCMDVLDRGSQAVAMEDKYEVYLYYVKKVEDYYGATKTREVYERALESVPDEKVKDIAIRFADLECKLGEIDRARGIWVYASQYCNPKTQITFWTLWKEFEVAHGNTETFKEMLRIKRSVEAEYMQNEVISADMADVSISAGDNKSGISGFKRGANEGGTRKSTIEDLESKAAKVVDVGKETKEMEIFKKAVAADPSLLERVGRETDVIEKNIEGASTEKEYNQSL